MTSTRSDDDKLAAYAEDLIVALVRHVPDWVESTVNRRLIDGAISGGLLEDEIEATLQRVTLLLRADIDQQASNPLAVIRTLVGPMTSYLDARGVEPEQRDADAIRLFPDDRFDLTPGAFSDIHPDLHLTGLSWGAAKAHVHLRRRRAEGMIP